jgi:hypothetical protein
MDHYARYHTIEHDIRKCDNLRSEATSFRTQIATELVFIEYDIYLNDAEKAKWHVIYDELLNELC